MAPSVRPELVTPDDAEYQAWKAARSAPPRVPDEDEFTAWKQARGTRPPLQARGDVDLRDPAPAVPTTPAPRTSPRVRAPIAARGSGAVQPSLESGKEAAAGFFQGAEEAAQTGARILTAAPKAAFTSGQFLGQRINDAIDPNANDVAAAMGVPRVGNREALVSAAQLGTVALGPAGRRVVGRVLAPAIGSRAAGSVATTAEGAAIGAAYDPEHPVRGAVVGGAIGGTANEADPFRPKARVRVSSVAGQDAMVPPNRVLPRRTQPTAEARVVDETPPPASHEPDYTVEDVAAHPVPDEAEFAAWKREQAPSGSPSTKPRAPAVTPPKGFKLPGDELPTEAPPELADVERAILTLKSEQVVAKDPELVGELASRVSMLEAQRRKLLGEPEPEMATAEAARESVRTGVRNAPPASETPASATPPAEVTPQEAPASTPASVPAPEEPVLAARAADGGGASSAPERIRAAAVKLPSGRIVEGVNHQQALEKAQRAGLVDSHWKPDYDFDDGWATSRGRFVDREKGYTIAESQQQLRSRNAARELTHDEFVGGGTPSAASDLHFATAAGAPAGGGSPPAAAAPPATPAVAAPTVNRHVAALKTVLAPQTLTPESGKMGRIVREHTGVSAQQLEHAREEMKGFSKSFDRMAPPDRLDFIDKMETGAAQATPELTKAAATIRQFLDDARDEIRALGTGKLEAWIQNYFPHIWEDEKAAKLTIGRILGKRPLEGTKSFLKQRTIPTTKDGIAAGLVPVTDNPVDLTLLKLREMRRYLAAHRILQEAEGQGLAQYVHATAKGPEGYQRINDGIGTVYGKPSVTAAETYDKAVRDGLEAAIARLQGLKHERKVSTGQRGALGYAKGADEMVTKFGTDDGVMVHELGHILDARYGLGKKLGADARTVKELSDLAALRHEGVPNATKKFKKYVQMPEEQTANALHALLHAPEQMAKVAPVTKELLEQFLASKAELKPILDIKPGLALGTRKAELPVGGLVVRGHYYAPDAVARVLNNYLSPGLRGNALYDSYQGINNTLNQAQLGLSAFHVGFTSMDAAVSQAAVGLQHISRGRVLKGAAQIATYPVAPITTFWRGSKVLKAYLHPQGQPSEMLQLLDAITAAGGRARQDSFYATDAPKKFMEAIRHARVLSAARYSLPALLELAAKPVMEVVVPRQKLGVFAQLAERAMLDLPPNATRDQLREAYGRAWDSVDNRLGQLVYDNLFWEKTLKDLSMASVRSVGWNLGTLRELGGGAYDLGKAGVRIGQGKTPELTERASYAVMLPLIVGLSGAIVGYLLTGERPKELKDYFFPKTGKKNVEGNDERVQLPSYMKDVIAYGNHPVQTLEHKEAPLPNMISAMLHNEDFYGDQIRNVDDPLVQQLQQEASYLAQQFVPLGVRNAQESSKRVADPRMKIAGFFGVTAAPRAATRSPAENKIMEFLATKGSRGATPEAKTKREERAALMTSARQGSLDEQALDAAEQQGKVTLRQRVGIERTAEGDTDLWLDRYKKLGVDEALTVYKLAKPAERETFRDALERKMIKAGREDELDALDQGDPVRVSSTKPRVRVP